MGTKPANLESWTKSFKQHYILATMSPPGPFCWTMLDRRLGVWKNSRASSTTQLVTLEWPGPRKGGITIPIFAKLQINSLESQTTSFYAPTALCFNIYHILSCIHISYFITLCCGGLTHRPLVQESYKTRKWPTKSMVGVTGRYVHVFVS